MSFQVDCTSPQCPASAGARAQDTAPPESESYAGRFASIQRSVGNRDNPRRGQIAASCSGPQQAAGGDSRALVAVPRAVAASRGAFPSPVSGLGGCLPAPGRTYIPPSDVPSSGHLPSPQDSSDGPLRPAPAGHLPPSFLGLGDGPPPLPRADGPPPLPRTDHLPPPFLGLEEEPPEAQDPAEREAASEPPAIPFDRIYGGSTSRLKFFV